MNNPDLNLDLERKKILEYFRIAAVATLSILGIGVVFYHFIEKMSWVDSIYFCVVTLTTIGYGDITPQTDLGKIFTVFYILAGVGILAAFLNLAIKRALINKRSSK